MFLRKINNHNGQALLIVVLVMVIALTVTLSLVSRSIINVKTSVDQTNSQKALAAAEAGVEQAIKNNANYGQGSSGPANISGAQYSAVIQDVSDDSGFLVNGGNLVTKDEGAYIWLSPYSTSNPWSQPWPSANQAETADLRIYWGDSTGADKNAAIEIVLIYGANENNALTKRFVFDPSATRANSNNFNGTVESAGYTVSGKSFKYRATVTVSQGLLIRAIPIYSSAYMAIRKASSADPDLPQQGRTITASGCTPNCTDPGIVQRKVVVFEGYPVMPVELFPFSIFSP